MPSLKFKGKTINKKAYEDIQIGTDPEMRFEGIQARRVVPENGKFGADGPNSHVGELRPDPAFCPLTHTDKIERVMRDGFRKYDQIQKRRWLAGSYPDSHPIGGHIHFGSPANIDLELKLEALDKLLAPTVMMLEDVEKSRSRRHNHQYGKLALHNRFTNHHISPEYRGYKTKTDYAGGHGLVHDGYEYRPLPSWLVSKAITAGVLSLAKVIAFQTHNKSLHRGIGLKLKFVSHDRRFQEAYQNCDKRYFVDKIPTIERIVKSFKLYPTYAKYINHLFQLIAQGRTWNEDSDLKTRWDIVPKIRKTAKASVSKSKMSLDDIWDNALEAPSTNNGPVEHTPFAL